ncbi:MAG TPA: pitrilysin family protein [Methylomirabilota bacterium]|nr:pitrilysin family protein [Methylomirabilota bacterium]
MRRRLLAAALLLLAAAPAPAPAQSREGVRQTRLPNGLTVIVRESAIAPVVAVSLLVRMGTRWETPETAGLSNFVHAVMVKGTTKRSGSELAEAIAALGGKISASGEGDYSEIRASALARFWRELLGLTAELALQPKLAPEEVDRERDFVLSRVQRRRDNAPSRAFDEFFALLYGRHPYGIPGLGTPVSLARVNHAAVVARYRDFYHPDRLVLAVSGQVRAEEVLAEAERLFGGMPAASTAALDAPVPAPVAGARRQVIEQPANQTQILVGGLAPPLDHPDHAAVKVLSSVLGGGMAGRLFVELRDKRALAYTATSFYEPVKDVGALVLYLGTTPETAAQAEQGLRAEIARIQREPVPAAELERAKSYLLGRYAMDRRTSERLAWYLAFYEVERVGLDYPERYRRAVEAVTVADVQRVATTYLATPVTIVLGPRPAR